MRRHRPPTERAFTDAEIATAIAAHLAGLSMVKAARMIRASAQSLSKNWMKVPELMTAGRALFDQAKADAALAAEKRRALEAFEAEASRVTTERINLPILGRMPERHRAIMELRIEGQSLQQVGDAFGVTRERIRQIEAKWRATGLIVPGANPLSEAAKAKFGWKPPQRRGPKAGAKRKSYQISDLERSRRAERMRGVSRARWDARA